MSNLVPTNPTGVVTRDSTAVGRRQLSDKELAGMIGPEVLKLVQSRATFTAFNVTTTLRQTNPGAEIDHERCKALVHIAMNYFLDDTTGDYDKVLVNRGWKHAAWEYFPRQAIPPTGIPPARLK